METIFLWLLGAISLYYIDFSSQPNPVLFWCYVILIILYIFWKIRIHNLLEMKTNYLLKINNFFLHISLLMVFLIIIYWISGASLWEWRILSYNYIQYAVFMIFLMPFFLWIQIFYSVKFFNLFRNRVLLIVMYLFFPIAFLTFSKENVLIWKRDRILTFNTIRLLSVFFIFSLFTLSLLYFIYRIDNYKANFNDQMSPSVNRFEWK